MAGVLEEHRRQFALILSAAGIVLIIIGFGLIVHHQEQLESGQISQPPLTAEARALTARQLKQVLFFLVVLVGIFSVSVYAFLRWSRSFRRSLLRRPHPPTPADDVWSMHRLPPDVENEPEPPARPADLE
jgi:hypothetical protein